MPTKEHLIRISRTRALFSIVLLTQVDNGFGNFSLDSLDSIFDVFAIGSGGNMISDAAVT